MPAAPPAPPRSALRRAGLILALSLCAGYVALPHLPGSAVAGARLLFDYWDLTVYFEESRWAYSGQAPYLDIPSEYPLLANLAFGVVHALSRPALYAVLPRLPEALLPQAPYLAFVWLWLAAALTLLLLAAGHAWRLRPANLLLWLGPASLYFALYRFDVYPAVATLLFLRALHRRRATAAVLWLGLAIALKGYAVVLLPVLFCTLRAEAGPRRAAALCGLALAPFALQNLALWAALGRQAMLLPYRIQSQRGLTGESSWDALLTLCGLGWAGGAAGLRRVLLGARPDLARGALAAMAPCLARPRTAERATAAMLVALLGWLCCASFYSPQFLLWLLPLVSYLRSGPLLWGTALYGLLSYLYFPVVFDLGRAWLPLVVVAVSGARLALWALAVRHLRRPGPAAQGPAGSAPG